MFASALYIATLRNLRKAEGDRGGEVIGRTARGRPIYASSHHGHAKMLSEAGHGRAVSGHALRRMYPHFSAHDHAEAAEAHVTQAGHQSGEARAHSHMLAQGHASAAGYMRSNSNEKKLSPGD